MQFLRPVFVVFALSLIDAALVRSFRPPAFCKTYHCPAFVKMMNTSDYELRCYNESYWATTNMTGSGEFSSYTAFMRLFRYIQGANDKELKIDMTVPVTKKIITDKEGTGCMGFFIPSNQETPPVPTMSSVRVVRVEPFCAYVKVYGGYSTKTKVKQNAKDLADALKSDGLTDYIGDFFYTAGYDKPSKVFNRHNEIWFIKAARKGQRLSGKPSVRGVDVFETV